MLRINISKLKKEIEGKDKLIVKNYKVLCELIEEEIKQGKKAKQYHIREIERYFSLEKIEGTQKYVINEIYSEPLSKVDLRDEANKDGKNSKYITEIQDILTYYIYENRSPDGRVLLSFSKLINILGLVNNTYTVANNKKRELSDILKVDIKAVHYFYNNTRSEFKNIVERALSNLEKRSVIHYNKSFIIAEKENGNKTGLKYREATKEEISMILDAQKSVLEYLKLSNIQDLFLAGSSKYKEYIELVNKELPRNWVYYYNVYELIVGKYAIESEYKDVIKRKQELNKKSIERMDKHLKVVNDSDDEKKLIDALINIINYDFNLDESIIALYNQRKEENKNKIADNIIKLAELKEKEEELKKEQEKLSDNIKLSEQVFNNRDAIDKFDYYDYTKHKKELKNIKDCGFDTIKYKTLDNAFADYF